MKVPLVILGSARENSDTRKFMNLMFDSCEYKMFDLLENPVSPYDYSGSYPTDDAFPQLKQLLLEHQSLVFATPVYWYSMSGLMKTFFDRLTDLITIDKPAGRKLKGKRTFLLAVGSDPKMSDGFEVPFRETSAYLGMHFQGSWYCPVSLIGSAPEKRDEFQKLILQ
jgi:NAD(P)H-dependent FMN reductase